jgi:putative ABC transport system ATP-binding protein
MRPVVELRDVRKTYPGPLEVLHGVNLAIQAGELMAIVGPSGSGKSTLLHLMGTLERPSSGAILVDGQDVTGLGDRRLAGLRARRIGFVFQRFFLLEAVSALENVADGLLYSGVPLRERRHRAAEMLERVGLADRVKHRPPELSGGERQRVAIARALIGRPALLLADEPTGNLDTATGRPILDLLTGLNREGTTVVMITHDSEVAAVATREIRIRDGLIQSDRMRSPA